MNESSGGTLAQQRLTYQHMIGAIFAIGIFSDDEMEALHCETLDDLLLERATVDYTCVQVTSKGAGFQPFKARDEKVIHTFRTFCILERDHGHKVSAYRFLASCGFLTDGSEDQNLHQVISSARSVTAAEYGSHTHVSKFFKKLAKVCDEDALACLASVFEKVELASGPDLNSAFDSLYRAISDAIADREPTPACVRRVLKALMLRVEQAASQRIERSNMIYVAAAGSDAIRAEILKVKRIDKAEIRNIVETELANQASESPSSPNLADDPFPLIRQKITLNGGSELSIQTLQESAFHAIREARARQISLGKRAAEGYQSRIRAAAMRLYTRLYERQEAKGPVRASRLYQDVDSSLRAFIEERRSDFPSLGEEELLGTLALITNECKAWWGPRRDLESLA